MMTAVRVSGVLFLVALGFAALPVTGCGSDSGSKASGGTGGSKNTEDAGPPPAAIPEGSVGCGAKVCAPPDTGTGTACCRDSFQSLCGVNVGMGCAAPAKPPPKGCPALPVVMGFMTNACCTTMGKCGVDLTMLGQGCIDTVTAAAQAMAMGIMVPQTVTEASCTPGDGGT
jgi:hypothetical protein